MGILIGDKESYYEENFNNMETSKLKAIREAYGEYWEEVKEQVNSSGWVKESIWGDFIEKPNIQMQDGSTGILRPISLIGIETNNGWIKIESEADLPKEFGKYWIIDKDNGKMYQREFDKSTKSFFLEYSTHYQPIIKPQPPIY